MNLQTALPSLIGDLGRFGPMAERVEILIDMQLARITGKTGEWVVLPWIDGFYLLSRDPEGQRRGRELIVAFLGPAVASVESLSSRSAELPAEWLATGFVRGSYLRRVVSGARAADEMLRRLEDLVSTMRGRPRPVEQVGELSYTDLLRDLRLALLQRDDGIARRLLKQIQLSGQVSAENLRFLRIEYLAAFGRWAEMRDLPHISALTRARRPRAISETLVQMIWWTDLRTPGYPDLREAFVAQNVLAEFGQLLRALRVPATPEGRVVCMLAALVEQDDVWRDALVAASQNAKEEAHLRTLIVDSVQEAPKVSHEEQDFAPAIDPTAEAFASGRFDEALEAFVALPNPDFADQAVEAVLDSGLTEYAAPILSVVRGWIEDGQVVARRRLAADLEDLARLIGDICSDWVQWAERLAGGDRWADAGVVVRDRVNEWRPLAQLNAVEVTHLADALIAATTGANEDQLRASLDVLCLEASALLTKVGANDFCRAVLLILAEQENFSISVRAAFSDLFSAWVQAGPTGVEYKEILDLSLAIWSRITSAYAVDWALGLLDAAVDAPCPDRPSLETLTQQFISDSRQYANRLSLRQRVDIEALAGELGMPVQPVESDEDDRNVWAKADGKLVGLYSLLPRAASSLEGRLGLLCHPRDVVGNSDEVSTPALRSLAQRADLLVVDTWHAAHQATAAIDAVRPRAKQILPRQKGVSGFLRALEDALAE